jgi:REP element-mobilizing transposase RayT
MARKPRHWRPGTAQHLISRFVDRRFHLLSEEDRGDYLGYYGSVQDRWDWQTLSYALMSSHVHFGLVAGVLPLEAVFRSVHTRAARRFHQEHGTLGTLFADRPKLYEVHESALARLVAYHHRNPVSAGLVVRASDSSWTSHRTYLRKAPAPAWLDVERNLALLGFSDTPSGRAEFDDFVNEVVLEEGGPRVPDPELSCAASAKPLGDEEWDRLLGEAASVAQCSRAALCGSRCHTASLGRRLVALFAHEHGRTTLATIGDRLGLCPSAVHRLIRRKPRNSELFGRRMDELRERMKLGS